MLQHRSASSSRLSLDFPDLPGKPAYTLKPGQPSPGQHSLLRPPFAVTPSTGILTCFPSTLRLSASPWGQLTLPRLTLDRNPWSSGEWALHPLYRYLCQHSHFLIPPACLTAHLRRLTERSPTQQRISVAAAASGAWFSPVTSSAQADSTSELLRFL